MCKQPQSLLLRRGHGRGAVDKEKIKTEKPNNGVDRRVRGWNKSPASDSFSLHISRHAWRSVWQRAPQTKSLWRCSRPSITKVGFIVSESPFVKIRIDHHNKWRPTHTCVAIMDHHYQTLFVRWCHVSQRLCCTLSVTSRMTDGSQKEFSAGTHWSVNAPVSCKTVWQSARKALSWYSYYCNTYILF